MPNEVVTVETITLRDKEEVELLPLVIFEKRKFMRIWSEHVASVTEVLQQMSEQSTETPKHDEDGKEVRSETPLITDAEMNDRQYDTYMELVCLCLEDQLKKGKTPAKYREYLEKNLDEDGVHKVMKVCGGLDLRSEDNPN